MSTTGSLTLARPRPREASIDPTIRAAQRGDPEAFDTLYDQFAGRVHAICLRMAADPVRAGELVQDVFVRCWEQLPSYRGESAFSTWLHRLAVNVVLGARRAEGRRRSRVALTGDLSEHLGDGVTRPVDTGLAIDLERAIAALPEMLRHVLVLHDVEGVSHVEIAEALEIPVGTCRSHLFRARRTLREVLR